MSWGGRGGVPLGDDDRACPDTGPVTEPVLLTGADLTLDDLAAIAGGSGVAADADALARMAQAAGLAGDIATRRAVYGRTTGVGAARDQETEPGGDHGPALLRSHAAGWGDELTGPVVRVALAIRANQLLGGRSGASPALASALVDLANAPDAELPVVHRHGGLGTGDLTALAEVGLALLGERPRRDGAPRHELSLGAADALPLLSSNAWSLAEAGLGSAQLLRAAATADTTCALSLLAWQGNPEAFSPEAEEAALFQGAREVTARVRTLVAGERLQPSHLQDFFGLRTWPLAHGPLLDALRDLRTTVEAMANADTANPLFTAGAEGAPTVTHHGGFHAAYLALGIDATLQAMVRSAQAVQSRVAHLLTARDSGLPLFLADETSASSGLLIAEYVAASAVAVIREAAAAPTSIHTASASAGIEDDASFAPQAAARLGRAAPAYRRLVAVELVCAVRALRLRGVAPSRALAAAWTEAEALPSELADRDLAGDFDLAEALLDRLSDGVR